MWPVSQQGPKCYEEVMHVNGAETQGGHKEGQDTGADAGERQESLPAIF